MICTHCDGSGFLNYDDRIASLDGNHEAILKWIRAHRDGTDMSVCDCCGDGEGNWHGEPGSHYGPDDPLGKNGPYAYNGGLCECH